MTAFTDTQGLATPLTVYNSLPTEEFAQTRSVSPDVNL